MNMLESALNIVSVLEEIFQDEDAMIAIADLDRLIYYRAGKTVDVGSSKGTKLINGDGLYETIQSRKTMRIIVPKEVRGVPFKAITVPLFDKNKQIVGAFGVGWGLDEKTRLFEQLSAVTQSLVSSIENIAAGMDEITLNAQDISSSQEAMVSSAQVTRESVEETTKITDFVKGISNKTNMLGLNAAIEAARAGKDGRGFQVVASEIRKLSINSKGAVGQIEKSLKDMQESMNFIISKIENNASATQSQAAASEEINASIQELRSLAESLLKVTKELELK